jgi:hypothetical protein
MHHRGNKSVVQNLLTWVDFRSAFSDFSEALSEFLLEVIDSKSFTLASLKLLVSKSEFLFFLGDDCILFLFVHLLA